MNAGLSGVRHGDSFNIQRCMLVIGLFGVITLVSYFNELAKAGLLFRNHNAYRRVGRSTEVSRIVHKNGNLQQIDLDLAHVKQVLEGESAHRHNAGKINIALNIGKNNSYESSTNGTKVRVYHHENILPNFFLSLNHSLANLSEPTSTDEQLILLNNQTAKTYTEATRVLLYQHEWGGYVTRDCIKNLAQQDHLSIIHSPLNQAYRQEWELFSTKKKNLFKVLYGGVSFGICESITLPCNYFAMITHPVDRVLQVYFQCKKDHSHAFCHFDKLNVTDMNLLRFIKSQGSGFFKKLLYYSRHCKLVGDDELCLQDPKSAFVFNQGEREIYLRNILDNLSSWFSVIGLVEHFSESMELFEHVFHQNFTGCNVAGHYLPHHLLNSKPESMMVEDIEEHLEKELRDEYYLVREKLLNDTQVLKWLHADLVIYDKLKQIFEEQLKMYGLIQSARKTLDSNVNKLNKERVKNETLQREDNVIGMRSATDLASKLDKKNSALHVISKTNSSQDMKWLHSNRTYVKDKDLNEKSPKLLTKKQKKLKKMRNKQKHQEKTSKEEMLANGLKREAEKNVSDN